MLYVVFSLMRKGKKKKGEKNKLKKVSEKALSVLLTLVILLPLLISVVPVSLNPSLVKAASSAAITLDISEGYVGDYITVNGSGFTANKDVTFTWGDKLFSSLGFIISPGYKRPSIARVSVGEVHTDALGNFKVQLQVPKLMEGDYTIKADDTVTSATSSFTINPLIKLVNEYAYETHGNVQTPSDNPSSAYYIDLFLTEGFVNDRLGIQLSGFQRGETVEVKMGTTHIGDAADFIVGSSVTTEGYLFETAAARVPNIAGGTYTVTATGTVSGITASTTFTIKPELFLAIPWSPPANPPPAGLGWSSNWVYYYSESGGRLGAAWYTSIGTSSGSPFAFEATGLTGTSISSVTLTLPGQTMTITPTGTLALQTGTGATQGISASTLPYVSASPFGPNSPVARTTAALSAGQMINVTITTSGTGAASFTFTKQLFSSNPSTSDTEGTLVWVEGDSTIASDGTSLSGFVNDKDKLAITGLKASASSLYPSPVYATGSTVQEWDIDALAMLSLSLYDQDVTPVSFYDANTNTVWNVDETVYVDNDNSGTVTAGDDRVTLLTLAGSTFLPWSTVGAADPDVSRSLVKFPKSTRPALYSSGSYQLVYLDENADSIVSKGDTRISTVLAYVGGGPTSADLNGFASTTWTIPSIPGGGVQYNVGLWNLGVGSYGVKAGNTITMEIMPKITVTAPTSYQSTRYVTEGSSVTITGNGFFGAEPITISVGGKYVTTPTPPDAYGVLGSTTITMPALAGGEQTITVQGKFTTDNTASADVTYTPALRVSPTTGYNLNPVTAISVTGIGFEADTYQIIFDGAGIGQAVTSAFTVADTGDFAGQINIAFNLPEGVEGAHIVDIVKTSDTTKSIFYDASYFYYSVGWTLRPNAPFPTNTEFPTVTIYPSLQRTPSTTIVGTSVTVTGKGLQPSTTYYVWYDPRGTSTSQAVLMTTTPTTVTTNAKGTLTASFQIPQSSGGTRGIWVSTSNTFINNDPVSGSPVYTSVSVSPAMTLSSSSGAVGASINVSFTGLYAGSQYQLWWYKPEEVIGSWGQVAPSAIPLTTLTGAMYGNATEPVSFTVPLTAEIGTVYAVHLTPYGSRSSESPPPSFFTVGKVATIITLSCTPSTVTQGENVTINGVITPALSVNITLFIKDPEGTSTNKTITSASSGTFTDTFKADKAGTWQVTAKWNGDSTFAAYTSLAATATVKPFDISWTYAVAGLVIGAIALVAGLIALYYFSRKKRVAPPT